MNLSRSRNREIILNTNWKYIKIFIDVIWALHFHFIYIFVNRKNSKIPW